MAQNSAHSPQNASSPKRLPEGIDTTVPNVARIYDYLLDGKDNFAADRQAAHHLVTLVPAVRQSVWENRRFLRRVVRYLVADEVLTAAGLGWYEISNWAADGNRGPSRCAHNMLYWTGGDWWGVGPGAHSHVGGTRWWNVRHPAAYGARIGAGLSPGQAREILNGAEQQLERVMLAIRLADGCPVGVLSPEGRANAAAVVAEGLARPDAYAAGRIVLTRRGRLLADTATRMLTE